MLTTACFAGLVMASPLPTPEVAAEKLEPAPEVTRHHIRSPPEVNEDRLSPRHSLGSRLEAKYGSPYRQLRYSRSCIEFRSVRSTSHLLQDGDDTEEEGEEEEGEGAVRSSRRGVSASSGEGEKEEQSEAAFTAWDSSEVSAAPLGDCNAGEESCAAPDQETGKAGSFAALSGRASSLSDNSELSEDQREYEGNSERIDNEEKRVGLFTIGEVDSDSKSNASAREEEDENAEMLQKFPEPGRKPHFHDSSGYSDIFISNYVGRCLNRVDTF